MTIFVENGCKPIVAHFFVKIKNFLQKKKREDFMSKNSPPTALSTRRHQLSQYRYLLREVREGRLYLARLAGKLLRLDPTLSEAAELTEAQIAYSRSRTEENIKKCNELLRELENYIDGIEDSQIRHIFTLRYIYAYSWRRIAYAIGGYEESYARKKHDRYLEKNP